MHTSRVQRLARAICCKREVIRGARYSRDMTTWEYATVPLIDHVTKQILDQWGEDGWELVQVITGPTGGLVAYFKRPKP